FTAEVARAAQTCDPSVARTALLQGTGNCSTATLKTLALQRVTGLEPAQLSLSVVRAAVPNQPDRINVTITVIYSFDFVVRVFISPAQIRDETAIEI
ncbi:MAG: hypothetical protein N3D18_14145, partial [Roseococcus sp.]|nr:hypothetical protein [Roseococcus sp.]